MPCRGRYRDGKGFACEMGDGAIMDKNEKPARPPSTSAIGILMAVGLVAGGAIGGFGFASPAPGALIGGGIGILLGLLLDWRQRQGRS